MIHLHIMVLLNEGCFFSIFLERDEYFDLNPSFHYNFSFMKQRITTIIERYSGNIQRFNYGSLFLIFLTYFKVSIICLLDF